jgi:heme/copper-type cytochrome/quinol oxidase subunit 2
MSIFEINGYLNNYGLCIKKKKLDKQIKEILDNFFKVKPELNYENNKINDENKCFKVYYSDDNYLVLPINTSLRVLVSSNDVIHAFAVPSLGIKADCYPGRLNSLGFVINRETTFYGGCSELCGALHHAMPIGIKSVPLSRYLSYMNSVKSN